MPMYRVVTPLLNGGEEPIAPGEQVELTAKEAKGLLAVGAVEPAPAKPKAPQGAAQ